VGTFLVALFLFTGLVLVLGIPVFVVAMRRDRKDTARGFLIAGGVIGLLCAIISFSSEILESRCEAVGNSSCFDVGASGLQLVLVVGYVLSAWIVAYIQFRD
jgi:hypothetical protein